MSDKLTKIQTIQLDSRVLDLLQTVDFRKGNYHDKLTGRVVNLVQQILPLFPQISRSTIQFALKQLTGRAGPANPVGRPPKVNVLPPACPVETLDAPKQDNDAAAPAEPPETLSRYELVRRVNRRTSEITFGYWDTKAWEPFEVIVGSYLDTLEQIAILERQAETVVIGYKNGWPVKIENERIEEPEADAEEEEENEFALA